MHILIIEDDGETREFLSRGLKEVGHAVTLVEEGREGLFQATDSNYDAIIVDRMLPGLDGLSLLKMLRATGDLTPVLMLTAIGRIADRVEGLEAGADDYLVKPFAFSELLARLNALGRRQAPQVEQSRLTVGDIDIDFHRRTVHRGGKKVILQPREFSLLAEPVSYTHLTLPTTPYV